MRARLGCRSSARPTSSRRTAVTAWSACRSPAERRRLGGLRGTSPAPAPDRRDRTLPGGARPDPNRTRAGRRSLAVDDGGRIADHDAETVITTLDLRGVDAPVRGGRDAGSLRRGCPASALATPASYVGLVASAKRADAVLGYPRDRGVDEDQIARVHAPAGLDLGHVASDEIVVAIAAEIVRLRAAASSTRRRPLPGRCPTRRSIRSAA